MPIEIKELHIKVTVNAVQRGQQSGGGAVAAGTAGGDGTAKDAMVAECVEQVLQIVQNKAER